MPGDASAAALVVWALLVAEKSLSRERLRLTRRLLKGGDHGGRPPDAEKLSDWLYRTGRLRQRDDRFEAVHPSVVEGLGAIRAEEPDLATDLLTTLIERAVRSNETPLAFHLLDRALGREFPISPTVQDKIHAHVTREALRGSETRFDGALRDLARWGDPVDAACTLARALTARVPRRYGTVVFDHSWEPPCWTEDERRMVSASAEARALAGMFVRISLLELGIFSYPTKEVLRVFHELGWDMSGDCRAALDRALERGASADEDALVEGALSGPNADYESLITAVLQAEESVNAKFEEFEEETRRNPEISEDYVQHMHEILGEDYSSAERMLGATVRHRWRREGSQWLLGHERSSDLVRAWSKSLTESDLLADGVEVQALALACPPDDRRPVWRAIAKTRYRLLIAEVLAGLELGPPDHLNECLEATVNLITPNEFQQWAARRWPELPAERRQALAEAAARLQTLGRDDDGAYLQAFIGLPGYTGPLSSA